MKIELIQVENFKRIFQAKIEPFEMGLTVIGGNNAQGKSSVLDAILYALGGAKYKPSISKNTESVNDPSIKVVLDNGMVVERKGKNESLLISHPDGEKMGQKQLDYLFGQFALNLPKFLNASSKEKADLIIDLLGVKDEIEKIEKMEARAYEERTVVNRELTKKKKTLEELPIYPEVPDEEMTTDEIMQQLKEVQLFNIEQSNLAEKIIAKGNELTETEREINYLKELLDEKINKKDSLILEIKASQAEVKPLLSVDEYSKQLEDIELLNGKIRANKFRKGIEAESLLLKEESEELTNQIEEIRKRKTLLLMNAKFPLPEMGIADGELIYRGQRWDNMSGAEQLIVATALAKAVTPHSNVVLLDKLEQFDTMTLDTFDKWAKEQNLQIIATRVSTGKECDYIIDNGRSYK